MKLEWRTLDSLLFSGVVDDEVGQMRIGRTVTREMQVKVVWTTYRPVGCSYFPVWGVSSVSDTDMVVIVVGWHRGKWLQ